MEKPRVTEIKVRMDCNGCVQKIKKALHGITGISELYVDFPQQKITIIGSADPEHIMKAIKKTRKTAVICLHTEQPDQPTEPISEGGIPDGGVSTPPSPNPTNPPPEPPNTDPEPPKEPPPENPDVKPESTGPTQTPSEKTSQPRDEEIHVVYRYPPDNGYRYGYNSQYSVYPDFRPDQTYQAYPSYPRFREEQSHVPQSYHGTPGLRVEQFQNHQGYNGNTAFRGEQSHVPQPYHSNEGFREEQSQPYSGNPRSRIEQFQQHQGYNGNLAFRGEQFTQAQPVNVNHSYNTYRPSPYVTEYTNPIPRSLPNHYSNHTRPEYFNQETSYNMYRPSPHVTEYAPPRPPPPSYYAHYGRPETFNQEYYGANHGNGNITSIFSEENPNACKIV